MRHTAIAVAIFFFFAPIEALAFSYVCIDRDLEPADWVKKNLAEADVVFLDKVKSAEYPLPRNPPPAGPPAANSMTELLNAIKSGQNHEHLHQTIVFEILKLWKGEKTTLVIAKVYPSRGSGVASSLEKDSSYLIFGHKLEDGRISISLLCGATVRDQNAGEKIRILDKLSPTQ